MSQLSETTIKVSRILSKYQYVNGKYNFNYSYAEQLKGKTLKASLNLGMSNDWRYPESSYQMTLDPKLFTEIKRETGFKLINILFDTTTDKATAQVRLTFSQRIK